MDGCKIKIKQRRFVSCAVVVLVLLLLLLRSLTPPVRAQTADGRTDKRLKEEQVAQQAENTLV